MRDKPEYCTVDSELLTTDLGVPRRVSVFRINRTRNMQPKNVRTALHSSLRSGQHYTKTCPLDSCPLAYRRLLAARENSYGLALATTNNTSTSWNTASSSRRQEIPCGPLVGTKRGPSRGHRPDRIPRAQTRTNHVLLRRISYLNSR